MIYYVSGTKIYCLDPQAQKNEEIKSRILESYTEKIRENARRNEWKSTGSGAIFMGEGMGAMSPDTAARDINVIVDSVIEDNGLAVCSYREHALSLVVTLNAAADTKPWFSKIEFHLICSVRQRELILQTMASVSECLEEAPVAGAVYRYAD